MLCEATVDRDSSTYKYFYRSPLNSKNNIDFSKLLRESIENIITRGEYSI